MRAVPWIVLAGLIVALFYAIRLWRRRLEERRKASEERMASFIAEVAPPPLKQAPAPQRRVEPQERLLLDAAGKAAEAGEAALSIQLYARLLARYPQSVLAAQARAAVEEQKRRLAKA